MHLWQVSLANSSEVPFIPSVSISAAMRCCDSILTENNGVASEVTPLFSIRKIYYHHCRFAAALTLVFGVNGP